jgi:hypothetical protein
MTFKIVCIKCAASALVEGKRDSASRTASFLALPEGWSFRTNPHAPHLASAQCPKHTETAVHS